MLRRNGFAAKALLINLLMEGNCASVLDLLKGLLYFNLYRE